MNLLNMHILALDYGPDLLNDVANQYIKAINNGFGLIRGDVTHLLNVLIILSIIWSAAMWAVSEDQVIIQFARKVIYIGFFAWIIQNWQGLTDKLAMSFMQLGLKAGGFEGVGYYTQQPGNIAYLGYTTAGIIYLLICCTGVTGMLALVDGIIYLTKSDEEFIETYQLNQKEWF